MNVCLCSILSKCFSLWAWRMINTLEIIPKEPNKFLLWSNATCLNQFTSLWMKPSLTLFTIEKKIRFTVIVYRKYKNQSNLFTITDSVEIYLGFFSLPLGIELALVFGIQIQSPLSDPRRIKCLMVFVNKHLSFIQESGGNFIIPSHSLKVWIFAKRLTNVQK